MRVETGANLATLKTLTESRQDQTLKVSSEVVK